MIWAWGEFDPVFQGDRWRFPSHERDPFKRGVRSVFMKVPPPHRLFPDEEADYPQDTFHVDFKLKNVSCETQFSREQWIEQMGESIWCLQG